MVRALCMILWALSLAGCGNEYVEWAEAKSGLSCELKAECGDYVLVDCGSAVDGPAYYIDTTNDRAWACGGACLGGCSECPPDGWRCGR